MAINIRGIEINDKSDVQDVLTAFTILNNELETLKDEIVEQINKYNDLSDELKDDYTKRKEIIEAINILQTNSDELQKRYDTFKNNIDKDLKEELVNFSNALSVNLHNALKNVDTSKIETLLKQKIDYVNNNIENIYNITKSFLDNAKKEMQKQTQNTTNMLNKQKKIYAKIDNSISDLNSIVKNINIKAISVAFCAGIAISSGWAYYAIESNTNVQTLKNKIEQLNNTVANLKSKVLPDSYYCTLENGKNGICAYFKDNVKFLSNKHNQNVGVFIELK